MIEIKKIMLPTDFSDYARHALMYAVTLADSFKAKLYIIHAWEVPTLTIQQAEVYSSVNMAEIKQSEEELLRRLAEEVRAQGIDVETLFVPGRVYVEVVRKARDLEVDLIIMATHGRKGLSHLIFGSNAEKIVRLAPCPVLTVKHPEHDFVK